MTQLVHEALLASTSAVEPGDAFAAAVPMDAIVLPSADDTPGSGTVGRGIAYTGDRGPAVSSTLRQKIIDHKFVDLGALLDSPDQFHDIPSPAFQLVDGVLRAAPRSARPISSFGKWSVAFLRFAAIYLEAHPSHAIGLMRHMHQVSQLTAPGLGFAWREFDLYFRRARELDPAHHLWGQTASTSQMWLQAVAFGIGGAAKNPSAPAPAKARAFQVCRNFNSARGCRFQHCRFRHTCHFCRGSHPAARCPRRSGPQPACSQPSSAAAGIRK